MTNEVVGIFMDLDGISSTMGAWLEVWSPQISSMRAWKRLCSCRRTSGLPVSMQHNLEYVNKY